MRNDKYHFLQKKKVFYHFHLGDLKKNINFIVLSENNYLERHFTIARITNNHCQHHQYENKSLFLR
jgi:hypothetical protein